MADDDPVPVYRFDLVARLLCGWQVHAARQRLIHEQSARDRQHLHHWLGGSAVLFTALAGSSAATMLKERTVHTSLAFASVLLAAVATILAGIVTFLDLGSQAERHRMAAAHYKRALRDLEAMAPPGHMQLEELANQPDDSVVAQFVAKMRSTLGDIDAAAPIPPRRIANRIEKRRVEPRSSATRSIASPE